MLSCFCCWIYLWIPGLILESSVFTSFHITLHLCSRPGQRNVILNLSKTTAAKQQTWKYICSLHTNTQDINLPRKGKWCPLSTLFKSKASFHFRYYCNDWKPLIGRTRIPASTAQQSHWRWWSVESCKSRKTLFDELFWATGNPFWMQNWFLWWGNI